MRLLPLCAVFLTAIPAVGQEAPPPQDEVHAVQTRPLRQAKRFELTPYGSMSIGDPYLQRWGGGLRAMYHLREGISLGLDASGFGTWQTQEMVIAKRELRARIIDSRERGSLAAFAAIAPIYGKVALPGDALVHFETFVDLGMGGALSETDAGRGVRPMVAAGIGQRIFLNESLALTARLGGSAYAERVLIDGAPQTKAMGFWTLSFGLSFYLPGAREP